MDRELSRMRHGYVRARLAAGDLAANPLDELRAWVDDAAGAGVPEPNAMVLATVGDDGQPSTRNVLLKGIVGGGLVFYTNYGSRKATELAANPKASLCFSWLSLERQVVICGTARRLSEQANRAYWATRPRESQLGAWASRQSTVIESRAQLEAAARTFDLRFPGEVPWPQFWGGYRVVPVTVEFWQGGPGRLHDRLRYRRAQSGWRVERLAP